MSSEAKREFGRERGKFWLTLGLLGAPAAWFVQLQAAYLMVYVSCATGGRLPYHLVSVLMLAAALACAVLSWRNWQRVGGAEPDERAGVVPRTRFLAALGVLMGALFCLAIVAQWAPAFVLPPCNA